MRNVMVVLGLLLFSAGLFVYAFWQQLGLSCPCPGSGLIMLGAIALISRRFFPRAEASKPDTPASS